MFRVNKLSNCRWLNLFEVFYNRAGKREKSWLMCSRKTNPITDAAKADAVVIIPILKTKDGNRLVVTREFRVPIWDYEYGFPAGLIDDGEDIEKTMIRELREETGLELAKVHHVSMPVYSSAGMSDESCCMAVVEAKGTPSKQWLHTDEDIEVLLMDASQIKELLTSNKKIAAKAWGVFYHYAKTGNISE